jgi:hypothetical protein
VNVADAHRTAHEARCRGTPFAPPDVGWGVSLGSPRSSTAASRERAKIDGYACGAAKRSRTERATERAALVPGWSALQRRVDGAVRGAARDGDVLLAEVRAWRPCRRVKAGRPDGRTATPARTHGVAVDSVGRRRV